MIELLAPAGDKKNFFAAINNGADAVYLGLNDFSARKAAENFNGEDLSYFVAYAHTFGVKVYVALNTLIKTSELNNFFSALVAAYTSGVDAVILQDVFLGKFIKRNFKDLKLHLSTQAGINNVEGAKFALENGFDRVILARETNLENIRKISEIIETEIFVQGALCSSFSGHCYFSSFVGGNSGNRGFCKQPCRQKYEIETKNGSGKYSISLSDLCLINHLADIKDAGVSSIKIEGRLRSQEYVAATTKAYRNALDGKSFDMTEIERTFNRGNYTYGYLFGQDKNLISDKTQSHIGKYCGKVKKIIKDEIICDFKSNDGDAFKILRNGFEVGNAVSLGGKIKYSGDIKIGDALHITKDTKLADKLINAENKTIEVEISGEFKVGERGKLFANGITVETENVLSKALNAPLSKADVELNLNKTDKYPFAPKFADFRVENVFIPKSELNALRSKLYYELFYRNVKRESSFTFDSSIKNTSAKPDYETIVLAEKYVELKSDNTAFVYSPLDYNELDLAEVEKIKTEYSAVYLFVPSYLPEEDKEIILSQLKYFDGVYADGLSAIQIAKDYGKKLIIGSGVNVFNAFDINYLKQLTNNIVVSKELSKEDLKEFKDIAYIFTYGNVKLMELIYCPFGRNCGECKRGNYFKMTDEKGYKFYLRRQRINGKCRFEVYNGYKLSLPKTKYNFIGFIGIDEIETVGNTFGNYERGIK